MYVSPTIVKTVGLDSEPGEILAKIPAMMDCLPPAMIPFLETARVSQVMEDLIVLTFEERVAFEHCSREREAGAISRVASAMLRRPIRVAMQYLPLADVYRTPQLKS